MNRLLTRKINPDKTSMVFSASTTLEQREGIKALLGVQKIKSHIQYLGLRQIVLDQTARGLGFLRSRVHQFSIID
jgi:hypothetical protein